MTDRPWGATLAAIASRGHTGTLTVDSDGKRYTIAFTAGAITGAGSPLAADGIARIALTNHFITSTQVAEITRRIAAAPDRDEVEVLAEVIRTAPDQLGPLRQRLVAQRAARTFAIERGAFAVDEGAAPATPGVAVDHRQVVYLGARTHVGEQRMLDDLRQLGAAFTLRPDAVAELPRFGFEPAAQVVVDAVRAGTSLPALEAAHRELDPRLVQAVIYALATCNACVGPSRTLTPAPRVTASRAVTSPFSSRAKTSPTAYASVTAADSGTNTPAATRSRTQPDPVAPPVAPPPVMLRAPDPSAGRAKPSSVPSVAPVATPEAPMPPIAPAAPPPVAPPVFARAGTDDVVHFAPGSVEQRTPTGARAREFSDQRTPTADPALSRTGTGPAMARVSTSNAVAAEAAFKRGELAMKRDQPGDAILEFKAACELDPSDVDYAAMLGWAKFCAAGDKAAIGADTRKLLERAVFKSQRPERARFYLGRVERMLGRDKEALRHFQEVLEIKANHAEAASEIRAIEARLAAAKPGLFGRKK